MLNPKANIIIISIMVCFLFWPINALSTLEPFETSLYGEIQGQTTKEFINISRNSLMEDKNITFYRTLKTTSSTMPALFKEHNNNEFNYESNENNQKAATPTMASIKHVNSSSPEILRPTTTTSSAYFERVELQESLTQARDDKLLLHRNKRYLLFPEGTSFQLVFDLIIPIVDYTNYAIMGITCAVAWELPSKPPSEIIENFHHKLNDGTFGLSRRNDSTQQQLKYINSEGENENEDKQPKEQLSATVATTSAHENFITNALKSPPPLPPSRNLYYKNIQHEEHRLPTSPTASGTSFFYNQHPQNIKWQNYNLGTDDNYQRKTTMYGSANGQPIHRHYTQQSTIETKTRQYQQPKQTIPTYDNAGSLWSRNNWWERNKNRIEQQWHKNQQKWSPYEQIQPNGHAPNMFSQRTGRSRKVLKTTPKHRIYPVFGKRRKRSSSIYPNPSLNDQLSKKLEQIHNRELLLTRQKLYGKIEKLYRTRGHNGTACVLLALCETERIHLNSRNNETPQSFVMELLRSIFALPKDTLANAKDPLLHIDARYSDAVMSAHNDMSQSCGQKFDGCEYGISYDM